MNKKPRKSAFDRLVDRHLKIALAEIGPIIPWYDKDVDAWVFEHPLYPESYGGRSRHEVETNYPLYLRQLIESRLEGKLDPVTEERTIGRGGKRKGAGRPKGATRVASKTVRLPEDIASWIKSDCQHLDLIRKLMNSRSSSQQK